MDCTLLIRCSSFWSGDDGAPVGYWVNVDEDEWGWVEEDKMVLPRLKPGYRQSLIDACMSNNKSKRVPSFAIPFIVDTVLRVAERNAHLRQSGDWKPNGDDPVEKAIHPGPPLDATVDLAAPPDPLAYTFGCKSFNDAMI